jgi:hypothetical protein
MRYFILTYYKKADGKIDESAEVSKRVRPKDYQTANVILDFKDLSVLQCRMGDVQVPKDWERVLGYYYQHYPAIIERLLKENGYEIEKVEQPTEQAAEKADSN